jgi:6-phosphogluconolactonase
MAACGGVSQSPVTGTNPGGGTQPVSAAAQYLFVTGEISGNRSQIFGYKIQSDGTLAALSLPDLTSTYCCHQITAAGTTLYVADFGGGMAAWSIDPLTGQLTALPGSPFPGLPASAEGSPAACGKFLYATNGLPGVYGATIDSIGGLTEAPGSPFTSGGAPGKPAIDPSCRFVFVTNSADGASQPAGGTVYAYTADAATGQLNSVPGSPFTVGSSTSIISEAAVDATSKFLYVPNATDGIVSGSAISAAGALKPVPGSPFSAGQRPVFALAATVLSSGFLYVANAGSNDISVFAIDGGTGRLNPISHSATTSEPIFLVASGKFLYSFNAVSNSVSANNVSAYAIAADGTLTAIAPPPSLSYFPISATVATF